MDVLQQIQDDEYSFPYHYITQFKKGFTECYFDSWGINYVSTIEFILSKLEKEKFGSLIDIGCGDGRLTYEIQQSFPIKQIVGIDYSDRAINLAKSMNVSGNYKQINILSEKLSTKFDIGVLMEVFEHIDPTESDNFVNAISDIIAPNGFVYVTVPHVNKAIEYKHYRHFDSKLLIKCFERHFEPMEIVPFEKGKLRKKALDFILGNRLFVLNSGKIRNWVYNYYKNNLFVSTEESCNRIFIKFKRK